MENELITPEECQQLLRKAFDNIRGELKGLAAFFLEMFAYRECSPSFNKRQSKAINSFLQECALYQPDPKIRKKCWSTTGPYQFFRVLEGTLRDFEKK